MLIQQVIFIVEKVLLGLYLLYVVQLCLRIQIYKKIVVLSTTKAEYVAAIEVGKEMIWLHSFLDELGKKQEIGILHNDSQSAIFLAKNSTFHLKSKHIQMRYHFICYLVEDKLVILEKIYGSKNPINMLTTGVTIEKLKLCSASIHFIT